MGGTKKLSKFIVDWENGTRVACKNGAIEREMCINFCIFITFYNISVGQFSRGNCPSGQLRPGFSIETHFQV